MSEPTHEEESLRTLTQAGVLAAQVLRARFGGSGTSAGIAAEIARARAAGYTEQTPYDDLLRDLLGEQRWAWYVRDDARIAAAAAVTDADRAGIYDMEKLLARAVNRRAWETDPASPARSVAEILHYRVTTEAARRHPSVMKQAPARPQSKADFARTDRGDSPAPPPAPPEPMPVTPYDGKLRELLGADRWQWYEDDQRRRDVAKLLGQAAAEGRDMDKLLTEAVTMREFEKDARSPARRVASVLHYRIEQILASPPGEARQGDLPAGVAGVLSNAAAPASTSPRDQQARPGEDPYASGRPPVFRPGGRPSEGRDSR